MIVAMNPTSRIVHIMRDPNPGSFKEKVRCGSSILPLSYYKPTDVKNFVFNHTTRLCMKCWKPEEIKEFVTYIN